MWWEKFLLTRIAKLKFEDNYTTMLRSKTNREGDNLPTILLNILLEITQKQ
jgi:hypothetical protein